MKVNENIVLCGHSVQFLLILDNFGTNRILNLKKVSLYKPPLTPFRPSPAKQQGKILSFHLRGKTNRQMLCIKGGRKGDKNWRKHVRARYFCSILKFTVGKIFIYARIRRFSEFQIGQIFRMETVVLTYPYKIWVA